MSLIARLLVFLLIVDGLSAADKSFPVRSVFAKQIPAVSSGQVLIQSHLYLVCINTDAKQAAWIAYHVCRSDWDSANVLERNFSTPVDLRPICLEASDYASSGYDMGHLYGLQHVSANRYASEVNELQAIIAQRPALNRGPWLKAENAVHTLSATSNVFVMAGQLFETPMPALPKADEPHRVGSHCWMIFTDGGTESAYLFPQSASISDALSGFAVEPAALRKRISRTWWSGTE